VPCLVCMDLISVSTEGSMLFSCRHKGCKAQNKELSCAGYHENKEAIMIVDKSVKCSMYHKQSQVGHKPIEMYIRVSK